MSKMVKLMCLCSPFTSQGTNVYTGIGDWRASDDLTAILSAGHNKANIIGGTGVGASQTIDWQYNYAQLRLLYRDWFFQAFRNWNDAGDTYLLRTGGSVVDRSSLNVFQEQDLVLQVDADDVLDQAYQSFVGAPAVGRLVFGQVGLRF